MKKTLIAFSVTIMLSIALFLGVGLTGCDWFNTSVLGKPSQAELNAIKEKNEEAERKLKEMQVQETERLVALAQREKEQENNKVKTYHVVVGSYEEKDNADKMVSTLKGLGYTPYVFTLDNFTCVSALSFDTLLEAETELDKILDEDFCPEDAWVYKLPGY